MGGLVAGTAVGVGRSEELDGKSSHKERAKLQRFLDDAEDPLSSMLNMEKG